MLFMVHAPCATIRTRALVDEATEFVTANSHERAVPVFTDVSSHRSPNALELTGAGLTPRCHDDRRAAGVRCSDGLDDGKP